MGKQIMLYHGSEQIIEGPTYGKGKVNNDFVALGSIALKVRT